MGGHSNSFPAGSPASICPLCSLSPAEISSDLIFADRLDVFPRFGEAFRASVQISVPAASLWAGDIAYIVGNPRV